jgi:hypothetical protein
MHALMHTLYTHSYTHSCTHPPFHSYPLTPTPPTQSLIPTLTHPSHSRRCKARKQKEQQAVADAAEAMQSKKVRVSSDCKHGYGNARSLRANGTWGGSVHPQYLNSGSIRNTSTVNPPPFTLSPPAHPASPHSLPSPHLLLALSPRSPRPLYASPPRLPPRLLRRLLRVRDATSEREAERRRSTVRGVLVGFNRY